MVGRHDGQTSRGCAAAAAVVVVMVRAGGRSSRLQLFLVG